MKRCILVVIILFSCLGCTNMSTLANKKPPSDREISGEEYSRVVEWYYGDIDSHGYNDEVRGLIKWYMDDHKITVDEYKRIRNQVDLIPKKRLDSMID